MGPPANPDVGMEGALQRREGKWFCLLCAASLGDVPPHVHLAGGEHRSRLAWERAARGEDPPPPPPPPPPAPAGVAAQGDVALS
eukprot:7550117-Alexandrium_andersonii.AAC.1